MFLFSKQPSQDQILQNAKAKIRSLVDQHIETLGRKRLEGIKIDDYGVVDARRWNKECQYFVDKVVRPRLTDEEAEAVVGAGLSRIATELIEEPAREECQRIEQLSSDFSHGSDTSTAVSSGKHLAITRGLIIRPEPLEKILNGQKSWEMRGEHVRLRETIALIKKDSKAIYGVADIVDSLGPFTRPEMIANESKHRISPDRLDNPDVEGYRYAWVLDNVRRLRVPVPYKHRRGAVKFVILDDQSSTKLTQQLATM